MWSVATSLRTSSVSDQTNLSWSWSCRLILFCETRSCYARRHNHLERHNNSQYNLRISLNCTKEVSGTESPSGVHGQSPGRESGNEVPQKLATFLGLKIYPFFAQNTSIISYCNITHSSQCSKL